MFKILLIMFSGMLIGFIFKKRKSLIIITDKLAGWSIYLLLFLLGISIGSNEIMVKNFAGIGLTALILALSGITGSVLLSFIVYKLFFEKDDTI